MRVSVATLTYVTGGPGSPWPATKPPSRTRILPSPRRHARLNKGQQIHRNILSQCGDPATHRSPGYTGLPPSCFKGLEGGGRCSALQGLGYLDGSTSEHKRYTAEIFRKAKWPVAGSHAGPCYTC
ncbi:hypothetical protein E2C01_044715 [Portunus trituberculatus]|uniref:Uncharacterized protein n=1 Tax=Portunus trituberculatus TaxID=210409 RepID=A0A5B7FSU0_PORTR|nr:hypothetical protein [Portunus trituberculatus]